MDCLLKRHKMVGSGGFEPPLAESESAVLPLNEEPVKSVLYIGKRGSV